MATTKATTLAHTLGGISSDISTAEINRLDGVTGDIQTQITALDNAKAPLTVSTSAPSSPSSGDLWFDDTNNVIKVWSGSYWDQMSYVFKAEGGSVSTSNGIKTHTFTSGTDFSVLSGTAHITVIVLGGGGGGGSGNSSWAAGGGGGGYAKVTYSVSVGDYAVQVGSGGDGQTTCNNALTGSTGGTSSFNSAIYAYGGTGGGDSSEGGTGGSFSTTGSASVIATGNGGDGAGGGGDGTGGGGQNGGGSTYGSGASGVANGIAGNHASGNGNGGGGGHSCQSGHRGGGDGSDGIVIISYEV